MPTGVTLFRVQYLQTCQPVRLNFKNHFLKYSQVLVAEAELCNKLGIKKTWIKYKILMSIDLNDERDTIEEKKWKQKEKQKGREDWEMSQRKRKDKTAAIQQQKKQTTKLYMENSQHLFCDIGTFILSPKRTRKQNQLDNWRAKYKQNNTSSMKNIMQDYKTSKSISSDLFFAYFIHNFAYVFIIIT